MSKLVKICANRIVFFTFIAVILSLLMVYGIFASKIYITIFCCAFLILILFFSIFKKSKVLFILCLLSVLIFSTYLLVIFSNINKISIDEEKQYTVIGYVPAKQIEHENSTSIRLENCTIYDNETIVFNGVNINLIYVGENFNANIGDTIKLTGTLTKENLFNYGEFNQYNIPYGIYFTMVYFDDSIEILSNNITLKDSINKKVKTAFESALDYNTSALAYAVTFGDKSLITSTVSNGFRLGGLAHILAVSGLHTTIIFTLLAFALKRCRISKKLIGIIISIFLLLYAYLCSFSPSIVRASIMCIVFYFSFLTRSKPDALNILGLSGIIILLINPLDLFNIGFCLSFGCMFGIITLTNKLTIKCSKLKSITSVLALTTATQIATLPFLAKYFGYFSFVGFLTNILLLPLFTLLFSFIIICAFLSLIFTPSLILNIIGVGLNAFINLSVNSANLDFLIFNIFKIGTIGVIVYFLLLYALSGKFFLKKNIKIIMYSALILIVGISCIYSSLPKTALNTSYNLRTTNATQYFKTDNNNFCFINPFTSTQTLFESRQVLNSLNETSINNLVVTKYMKITLTNLKDFTKAININNVYLASYLYNEDSAIIKYLKENTNLQVIYDMQELNIGIYAQFILNTTTSGYVKYIINNEQYLAI